MEQQRKEVEEQQKQLQLQHDEKTKSEEEEEERRRHRDDEQRTEHAETPKVVLDEDFKRGMEELEEEVEQEVKEEEEEAAAEEIAEEAELEVELSVEAELEAELSVEAGDEAGPASARASPSPHHMELEGGHYRYPSPSPSPSLPPPLSAAPDVAATKKASTSYISSVKSVSSIGGCRSVDAFERIRTISEGAYGVVHEAIDKDTKEVVALKKIKMESSGVGFPVTSLREINILMSLEHPNLVQLREIVLGRRQGAVFMVMEYVPHELKALLKAKPEPFSASEVKCLMLQLLRAVALLHRHFVVHRDLKTSNLLLDANGILKVADLGLARKFGSPLAPLSPLVVTLWYRSPELLLGASEYSTAVDMWAIGCIMAELLTKTPLFEGAQGELDQLQRIFGLLGTPDRKRWPGFEQLPHAKTWAWKPQPHSLLPELLPRRALPGRPAYLTSVGLDLLSSLLAYDPAQRISAADALHHAWFTESPPPQNPAMISMSIPRRA